jgi:hypothetical protein
VKQPVPQRVLDAARMIGILGDTHGDGMAVKPAVEIAAAAGVHVFLSVGDFGIGPWPGDRKSFTKVVDRWLVRTDSWLLVTPGNHENYDRIDAAPRDEAGMTYLGERLRALPRGFRFHLADRTVGSLGGAVSVDRARRIEGASWWAQEFPDKDDLAALGETPLDLLVTHDVPAGVPLQSSFTDLDRGIEAEADDVRDLLREAVDATRPHLVLSGHWHQRLTHTLIRADGSETRCEVLPDEHKPYNASVLDLSTLGPLVDLRQWARAARVS